MLPPHIFGSVFVIFFISGRPPRASLRRRSSATPSRNEATLASFGCVFTFAIVFFFALGACFLLFICRASYDDSARLALSPSFRTRNESSSLTPDTRHLHFP